MLIDASHPEETRVVVVRGNRIEEFDFESEHKKQLKGNIYLARVTRVEPSLQAAFVEYGGNRHGFLAFSEIHPDYYQIPAADRLALLEEEEKAANDENDAEDAAAERSQKKDKNKRTKKEKSKKSISLDADGDTVSQDVDADHDSEENDDHDDDHDHTDENNEDSIESVGSEDALEEVPNYQRTQRRQYKIQEVIKRRQILLIQVVKEERGNKGAALTTYLSLAGRYSVLMPNTARGGGISRKITNIQDRKRLKDIVKDLEVPKGMGVILRTAGANRTKAEVKRDYEYLMRLWENVRNLTLESSAPALVYEEGSLIKRSIRDLYNKDISEILVAGDRGYREAKDFMRMLMPSHAKMVQPYRDPFPIFARNGIETQLDRMLQPQVTLKSGGYLVMNQTEALVAIDVNSGRSTKEHSIEETAYQTNLEAAEEVARQLRLRDLAGLVVIDFIDMEDKRNIRNVEKKLKDCLKDDRARIQVGRISHFGLMEMSRQRIRASVLESTMQPCPHCHGTGNIRSESSVALHVIRSIEEYLLRDLNYNIIVRTSVAIALYVLNNKRHVLGDLETRFGLTISIEADETLGTQHLTIIKGTPSEGTPITPTIPMPIDDEIDDFVDDVIIEEEREEKAVSNNSQKRRNRNKRGRQNDADDNAESSVKTHHSDDDQNDEDSRRRRRRGRRGGRRNRDGDYDRRRTPYAEPVGAFAAQALSEIKEARRQRRVPAAEPVGFDKSTQNLNSTKNGIMLEAKEANSKKSNHKRSRERNRKNNNVKVAQNAEAIVISDENTVTADLKAQKTVEAFVAAETLEIVDKTAVSQEEIGTKSKKSVGRPRKTAPKAKKTIATDVIDDKAELNDAVKVEEIAQPKPRKGRPKKEVAVKANKVTDEKVKKPSDEKLDNPTAITSKQSSIEIPSEEEKPKKGGWWQRKGFF